MHGLETQRKHSSENTVQLIIYVGVGLCKIWVLSRHVCIVFSRNQPIVMCRLTNCFIHGWTAEPNIQLLVVYDKIQYTCDEKGTTFCINVDNNIDNELYCAVSELPNHAYFINYG